MLTVVLSVIFCSAISVLVSTIITCKVSERIFRGAMEIVREAAEQKVVQK